MENMSSDRILAVRVFEGELERMKNLSNGQYDPVEKELDNIREWKIIENLDSKDQLKMLLKSVDQKLVDLYTHRNTLENKKEKRSLQRLKKKIIDKLNDEASNE